MIQSAAQLGVIHSFDEGPRHMVEAFEKEGDVNTTFDRLAANAPDVKQVPQSQPGGSTANPPGANK